MGEAAFGQLDFEPVLALRPGLAKGGLRCPPEVCWVCRLTEEGRLGFGGPPGFGAYPAQRYACPCHLPAVDRDHDSCLRKVALVGRYVLHYQYVLLITC